MIEGIPDPIEERDRREEVVLLSELVQLRISIQRASRDELIEDTDDERGKNSEDDVIVGHRPAFKRYLSRKIIEPGVLRIVISASCTRS